ncbi:MAG: class I SAM-dependent methyltransferase [Bacteroidota bacterium]
MHSFLTELIPHQASEWGAKVEALRKTLTAQRERILSFEDLGAGSDNSGSKTLQRSVSYLARLSARHRKEGELLYRLCKFYQPKRCLEFGTNLGISSLYQLGALEDSQFVSMEGAAPIAAVAQENFAHFGLDPEILVGEFSFLLEERLDLAEYRPDYVFVDGNHRYEPTIAYFERLLPHMQEGGIIVFDDINWSAEMQAAWQEIIAQPAVTLSFDLYVMGICFIHRPEPKAHIRVPYWPF